MSTHDDEHDATDPDAAPSNEGEVTEPAEVDEAEPVAAEPAPDEPTEAEVGSQDDDDDDAAAAVAAGAAATGVAYDADAVEARVVTAAPSSPGPDAGLEHLGAVDPDAEDDDDDRGGPLLVAGWIYLAVLFAVFLGLALLVFAFDDDDTEVVADETTTSTVAAAPIDVMFTVDGDRIVLSGAVPDRAAADQLIALAEARYPDGTVVDELTIDDGTTLTGGTITVSGRTDAGDGRPEGIAADVAAALGLSANPLDVDFAEVALSPIDALVELDGDAVTVSGALPDSGAVDDFAATVGETFGDADASGLTVDDTTTLEGGRITIRGTSLAGDTRASALAEALRGRYGDVGVEIDDTGVEIDTSTEALQALGQRLAEQLQAQPILFETGSAVIDEQSDAILEEVAAAIQAAPDVAVDIIGHTDDQGDEALNQELSEARAAAVLDRLVELGVDEARLSSDGAGESSPVADNATEEGRAENRRIEFRFDGVSTDTGALVVEDGDAASEGEDEES